MTAAPRYISTTAFGRQPMVEILAICADEGLDGVELSGNVGFDASSAAAVRKARLAGSRFLVHNYFPPPEVPFVLNLAVDDPDERRLSIEHCAAAIRLCAELGAPFYSVHAGFAARLRPESLGHPLADAPPIPRPQAERLFADAVTQLCEIARGFGVGLLIENNVVAPFNLRDGRNSLLLLATPEEMIQFCAAVGHPALGLLIDVAHWKVSARTLGFDSLGGLARVASWIRAFHVSDNDGTRDDNRAFGRDAWFMDVLAAHPALPRVIEIAPATPDQRRHCWNALS